MLNYSEIIKKFQQARVLLVGDLILDHYAFGKVNRVSPEAPIQILDITREEYRLGGAINVAHNMVSLGAQVTIAGVIGDDENGNILLDLLKKAKINPCAIREKTRPTTIKTRFIAGGGHLLRTDREKRHFLEKQSVEKLIAYVAQEIANNDVLIISDYAKGVLEPELTKKIIEMANNHDKPVVVGPKGDSWSHFTNATLISANRKETEAIVKFALTDKENIKKAGEKLLETLHIKIAVITLGADGIYVARKNENEFKIDAVAREVFDVTGAGDTVLALLGLCAAVKSPWREGVTLANTAAGIVVGKVGASTISTEEIYSKLTSKQISHVEKIKTMAEVLDKLQIKREKGQKVVFTNGCFDLLHPGHIRYLENCKRLYGDILVVGVNSDSSIKKNKGEKRPIVPQQDRLEMLSALSSVDYVVMFSDETPKNLIEKIKPDVLVKGGDWATKGVVGQEFVEKNGGEVKLCEIEKGYSSTNIIEKILENYK